MATIGGGIELFKPSKGGNIRAHWGKGKHRVNWNTKTRDPREALERAAEELRRRSAPLAAQPSRLAAAAPTAPQVAPAAAPAPAPAAPAPGAGALGDALARVLGPAPSATPGAAPAAAPQVAAAKPDLEDDEKIRRVHKVLGKGLAHATEGGMQRACRWAGREPEEIDDNELELIAEGFEALAAKYLGTKELTPWQKIATGVALGGWGMWMGGKPIPKPKKAPTLELVGQRPAPAPEGEGGGKDAGA